MTRFSLGAREVVWDVMTAADRVCRESSVPARRCQRKRREAPLLWRPGRPAERRPTRNLVFDRPAGTGSG